MIVVEARVVERQRGAPRDLAEQFDVVGTESPIGVARHDTDRPEDAAPRAQRHAHVRTEPEFLHDAIVLTVAAERLLHVVGDVGQKGALAGVERVHRRVVAVGVRRIDVAELFDEVLFRRVGVHRGDALDRVALLCIDEAHVPEEWHQQSGQRGQVPLVVERSAERDRTPRQELLRALVRRIDRHADHASQLSRGVVQRRIHGVHAELCAVLAAHVERALPGPASGQRPHDLLGGVSFEGHAEEVGRQPPDDLVTGPAVELLGIPIGEQDASVEIAGQHGRVDPFEQVRLQADEPGRSERRRAPRHRPQATRQHCPAASRTVVLRLCLLFSGSTLPGAQVSENFPQVGTEGHRHLVRKN